MAYTDFLVPTILFLVSSLLFLCCGRRYLEYTLTILLDTLNSVEDIHGKQIRGPKWKWIDGQTLDKFLHGRSLSEYWQQYGPVYRIWSGLNLEIVITKPADLRTFYSDSHFHNKSRSSNAGWFFHQLLGDCMGLINGTRWKRVRATFDSGFQHPKVRQRTRNICKYADQFISEMIKQNSTDGFLCMKAAEAVSRFPFFCTAAHIYGDLNNHEKGRLWELGQQNSKLMGYVLRGGIFRFNFSQFIYLKAGAELAEFGRAWAQFNHGIYQSRSMSSGQPLIVSIWQQRVDNKLTQEEVLQTLSEILFANLDVTTGALSWLIIFLATDNLIQDKIRAEVEENSSNLEEYYVRTDTLLAFALIETLRLRPFTVFSIPGSSPSEKMLGGYKIPANTSVVIDTLAINNNRAFWGENPDVFNPLRFKSIKRTELRYNIFTFGFGTRKCLGSHLGELMMKIFVATLLQACVLRIPPTNQGRECGSAWSTWVPISPQEVIFAKIV